MALCNDGGAVVAAMLAVEACIDKQDASVFQRDESAFAVAWIAWTGRQFEAAMGQDGWFGGGGDTCRCEQAGC